MSVEERKPSTEETRLEFIDISKGLLMILVVLGHAITTQVKNGSFFFECVWQAIWSFHMPVFFVISGFLFEKNYNKYLTREGGGIGRFIKKKFLFLMVPYLVWSLINYTIINVGNMVPVVGSILSKVGFSAVSLKSMLFSIVTYINHIDNHIWFVYALFLIFCIAIIFHGVLIRPVAIMGLVILQFVVSRTVELPQLLSQTQYHLTFFCLGMQVTWIGRMMKAPSRVKACIAAVFVLCGAFNVAYLTDSLPFELFFGADTILHYVVAVSGCITIFNLAEYIRRVDLIRRPLMVLSNYSYDIYLIHNPILVNGIVGVLLAIGITYYGLVVLAATLIGILISIFISKFILRKIKILSVLCLGHKSR